MCVLEIFDKEYYFLKTIGLLGGMSWESSLEYYRIINETVKERLGGLHSAQLLMFSFDFAEIEALQMAGQWDAATQRMIEAGQQLERGGADFIIICTNTMHKMADAMRAQLNIPILHIATPTAEKIKAQNIKKIGLLGTKFTMEENFYKQVLIDQGLEVIVPDASARAEVNRIIYEELVLGILKDDSRRAYQAIIADMQKAGAGGVILGCTEIGLLIQEKDSIIPTFDTTILHAVAAVDYALQDN